MKNILTAIIAAAVTFTFTVAFILKKMFLGTDIHVFGGDADPEDKDWLEKNGYKRTYLISRDGYCLHGLIIDNGSADWAVLAHGYDADAKSMAGYARRFVEKGFSVLMPDQRGYGRSGDNETTMGHLECYDMIDWSNKLINERNAKNITLFGVSMGAATVMLCADKKLPEQVRCIVEDCGYSSIREEFEHNMRQVMNLPPYPFLWAVDIITRISKGWSILRDADCVKAVKKAGVPMLFIHGEDDDFVPYSMHRKLYDACRRKDKEKLTVKGAKHTEACVIDPETYSEKVFGFIEKHSVK